MNATTETQFNNVTATIATAEKMVTVVEFTSDSMLTQINKLRDDAGVNFQRYVVAGRNAMYELMTEVYAAYCTTQGAANKAYVVDKLKAALIEQEVEIRSNTTDGIVFVRYIFAGLEFDDKKVSVYAKALQKGHKEKIAVGAFASWVRTNGGWEGVRKASVPKAAVNGPIATDLVAIALSTLGQRESVETLSVQWAADENFRFYIALRDDDGISGNLIDCALSADAGQRALKLFNDDRKKQATAAKHYTKPVSPFVVAKLELDVASQQVKLEELRLELKAAMAAENGDKCEMLRAELSAAEFVLDAISGSLAATKKKSK